MHRQEMGIYIHQVPRKSSGSLWLPSENYYG